MRKMLTVFYDINYGTSISFNKKHTSDIKLMNNHFHFSRHMT